MTVLKEKAVQRAKSSSWSIKKSDDHIEYSIASPEGISRSVAYSIFTGISLVFFDINAAYLPSEPNSYADSRVYQFNYCVNGRIEFFLDDNTYFYLTENGFAISSQDTGSASSFPTNSYQGINIFFDMDMLENTDDPILKAFALDFSQLQSKYFDKSNTFVANANQELKEIMDKMWSLFSVPSSFYARLYMIEFLHLMLCDKIYTERCNTFYTKVQIEIAKKAEQLMTVDLSEHIPIHRLAERFSVSETSLKNYFKSVYGQNISDYMRTLRMNLAAKLLSETTLPVSEISNRVGYTKQGKFAAVFKAYTGMSPLEYRRNEKLRSCHL